VKTALAVKMLRCNQLRGTLRRGRPRRWKFLSWIKADFTDRSMELFRALRFENRKVQRWEPDQRIRKTVDPGFHRDQNLETNAKCVISGLFNFEKIARAENDQHFEWRSLLGCEGSLHPDAAFRGCETEIQKPAPRSLPK